ncbi:MAG: VIT and VWA domain-containing protein [Nannocystaceae bacterium]
MRHAPRIVVLLLGPLVGLACGRSPFYTLDPDRLFAAQGEEEAPAPEVEVEFDLEWSAVPEAEWGQGAAPQVADVVYTDPGELPQIRIAGGDERASLRHTDVKAHLRGTIGEVVVRQTFVNDRPRPIEALYTFPLPENSAVTDMRMVIGERVIEAEIRERARAAEIYAEARQAGHTAALLEQERPNIFTQSVANIPAGAEIEVEIRYLQTLSVDAGEVEFVFPTVVGPRFIPGAATGGPQAGAGTYADTDRVPDASRITPPVRGEGVRSGHDIAIEVIAEGTGPITRWIAPQHPVAALETGERLHVKLADRSSIPNRDFVLRYRSAGAAPQAALFLGPSAGEDEGAFMLVAEPPRLDVDRLVGRREFIFVIDVSGSMSGAPLALAKSTMRGALATMRPVDTFDVVAFAGSTSRLWGAPRPANLDNLTQAFEYVDALGAGGGTMMADAVARALRDPVEAGRDRHVLIFTDGFIGNEDEITGGAAALIAAQRASGRRARVFGVGVGSAPNSALIASISRVGDGVPLYTREAGDVPRIVERFQRYTDQVVLADLAVAWGDLQVSETYPAAPSSLFAGHPLVIHGRYRGAPPRSITLSGRVGEATRTIPVAVIPTAERGDVLTRLWARAKVGELELARALAETSDALALAEKAILDVGLRYHLVTAFTSLVAVDRSRVVGEGAPEREVIAVESPLGVDPAMAGARMIRVGQANARYTVERAQIRVSPVGGTSRDFTAVVDLSPTAARDMSEGPSEPQFTPVLPGMAPPSGPRVPPEFLEGSGSWSYGAGGSRERRVSVRIGALTASGPVTVDTEALRRDLDRIREPLAQCFLAQGYPGFAHRRHLVLALHWDASGQLVELRSRRSLSDSLRGCLRKELGAVVAPRAAGGLVLEVRLTAWTRR